MEFIEIKKKQKLYSDQDFVNNAQTASSDFYRMLRRPSRYLGREILSLTSTTTRYTCFRLFHSVEDFDAARSEICFRSAYVTEFRRIISFPVFPCSAAVISLDSLVRAYDERAAPVTLCLTSLERRPRIFRTKSARARIAATIISAEKYKRDSKIAF